MTNTIHDLMNTRRPENNGITCPACGASMSIAKPGTFRMNLKDNSRLELDGSMVRYRSFLIGIEKILKGKNLFGTKPINRESPFKKESKDFPELEEGGFYAITPGAEEVEEFVAQSIDYLELRKILLSSEFPTLRELNFLEKRNSEVTKDLDTVYKQLQYLVKVLEPKTIAGPLPELIFAQPIVINWIDKVNQKIQSLNELLQEVCPNIYQYLIILEQLEKSSDSEPNLNLKEGVFRVKLILGILLGHQSDHNLEILQGLYGQEDQENQEDQEKIANTPFTLQRITIVPNELLNKLLCSEIVLENSNMGWNPQFISLVRQLTKDQDSNSGNTINLLDYNVKSSQDNKVASEHIKLIETEVSKFVDFACTGIISDTMKRSDDSNQLSQVQECGWYPKEETTESIIFMGSPGTGKSSALLTGFVNFYKNAAALGISIIFESPEDESRLKKLTAQYYNGQMPNANKIGDITTIKLSVESPIIEGFKKAHYVFVDIAGEVVANSLTKKGSDPGVLRRIKNAKTLVFFFDPSIEPSIRETLIKGDKDNNWQQLKESFQRVNESRQSRSEVSQIQLLLKLIKDLEKQKGGKIKDTNIICVMPKADLYYNQEQPEAFFLTRFYQGLIDSKILVPSHHYQEDSFVGFYSLAGVGSQLARDGFTIDRQQLIAQQISQLAMRCFSSIGNALGNDEKLQPLRISLNQTLETGLAATLHKAFGKDNVYFLPVSAQGEDSSSINLGHPPNQKLSEYIFILPIAFRGLASNSKSSKN